MDDGEAHTLGLLNELRELAEEIGTSTATTHTVFMRWCGRSTIPTFPMLQWTMRCSHPSTGGTATPSYQFRLTMNSRIIIIDAKGWIHFPMTGDPQICASRLRMPSGPS